MGGVKICLSVRGLAKRQTGWIHVFPNNPYATLKNVPKAGVFRYLFSLSVGSRVVGEKQATRNRNCCPGIHLKSSATHLQPEYNPAEQAKTTDLGGNFSTQKRIYTF